MERNPYAPPAAALDLPEPVVAVPDAVLKKIRNAWIAGVISAVVTLGTTLMAMNGVQIAGWDAWNLVDVALIAALTFGIYRKSRFCAVAMLAYFIISKILIFAESGKPTGLVTALIFLYFYAQGVQGTFAYRKLAKKT